MANKSSRGLVRAVHQSVPRARALERGPLEVETLRTLRVIFGSARKHDTDTRRIAGLPGSQLWALAEISGCKGIHVNGLSERMALHQTTASNLVNELVRRKLVRRVRDPADQRVVRMYPTSEGKRALLRAPGPHTGLLVDALRRLAPEQLAALHGALRGLVAAMFGTEPSSAGEPMLGE